MDRQGRSAAIKAVFHRRELLAVRIEDRLIRIPSYGYSSILVVVTFEPGFGSDHPASYSGRQGITLQRFITNTSIGYPGQAVGQ